MIDLTRDNITDAFARLADQPRDPRAQELMVSLASHLHDWIRETGLTHAEWVAGLMAATRAAEMTDGSRNEFALFSDMMGLTSLVDLLNTPAGATPSSPLGPFHRRGAPPLSNGGDLWKGQPGEVLVVVGRVVDAETAEGVAGATLDIWQNADNGLYAVQDQDQPELNYHGLLTCGPNGEFAFTTTVFKAYTVPEDGPVGDMLRALGREAWRPAHLHVIAESDGYQALVTELFLEGDPWLDRDAAFGVRRANVLRLERREDTTDLPGYLERRASLPSSFHKTEITIRIARKPNSGVVGA